MRVTGEALTDEQIRELRSTAAAQGDERTVIACCDALAACAEAAPKYRARCAEILNQRGGAS